MSPPRVELRDEAVLVLTPTGRDSALAVAVLAEHGLRVVACRDLDALCREMNDAVGAILLAEEALVPEALPRLVEALGRQSPWSNVPILIFSGGEPSEAASRRTLAAIAPLGDVALLDRPVRIIALVSMLRMALLARRRQYQVRDLLSWLERSIHDRDRFLAMLGHELRNPLAVIVLGLQLLERTADLDERTRRRFETIHRQTRHLVRLVDGLLDVARVTAGRIHLIREPVDLVALVKRCAHDAGAAIETQGLDFEVVGTEPTTVDGDPVRLEQIVTNLVTNATKYTLPGGSVRVSIRHDGSHAVLAVEDTGVGIAKEMLGRVFEPFVQAEGSLDRAAGGLGLGLSVAQSLATLHGGTLGVDSPGLGRGSCFTLTLPLAAGTDSRPASPPSAPAPTPAPLRLVVIEDDADIRENLRALLELSGHHVSVAADGTSGLASLLAEKPDAALVDIGLPGMDGYAIARALRGVLGDAIFLVAVTGYGQREDQQRATEAGFDAHLAKPVRIEAVEALLHQAARKHAPGTHAS